MHVLENDEILKFDCLTSLASFPDYTAPGRQRVTSFERRKASSQTSYVPQQSAALPTFGRSPLSGGGTTVTITSATTSSALGQPSSHNAPASIAARSMMAQSAVSPINKLSLSQPSLPQAFRNNSVTQDGAGGVALAPGLNSQLQGQAVKRSKSFTSATLTAQAQQHQQHLYGGMLLL